MSGIKIGNQDVKGIFLGDVQILGGIADLLQEISISPDYALNDSTGSFVLIANLSTNTIGLYIDGVWEYIPKQHIEWYRVNLDAEYPLTIDNQDNAIVRYFVSEKVTRKNYSTPITSFRTSSAENGDIIIEIYKNNDDSDINGYFAIAIIFDENNSI